MRADIERMLSGSRGRRLCLDLACSSDPNLQQAIFWLAYRASPQQSTLLIIGDGDRDEWEAQGDAYSLTQLASGICSLDTAEISDDAIRRSLRVAVDTARYWQAPDGEDLVASNPAVRDALTSIAATVLGSAAASTWGSPRTEQQWAVDWQDAPDAASLPSHAGALLADWHRGLLADEHSARAHRPVDPRSNWSGTWWSTPQNLTRSRGTVERALELVEDSMGWEVATVIPVRGTGRTYEVESAADWADLCLRYPIEVTASRRHDWFRVTGWEGRWLIPDWQRVAEEWDAVHLTVSAYLCAAATLIPVDEEYATVIAGWAPDETVWLTDSAHDAGPRERWLRCEENDEWFRQETETK